MEYRIAYAAPSVKTVEFWGENEWYWSLGGAFIYRLVGEVLFNASNNTGTRIGTKITTVTAQTAYLNGGEVATSGGQVLITC